MSAPSNPRFIAGAVCPCCQALDTTVLYRAGEKQVRSCIACDFHDQIDIHHISRELPTRVNAPHRQRSHAEQEDVSVVTIVDPHARRK